MPVRLLFGVLLIALGAWALSGHASYRTKREVLHVGDFRGTVREQHAIPRWAGYAALGAGVLLLVTATKRRA